MPRFDHIDDFHMWWSIDSIYSERVEFVKLSFDMVRFESGWKEPEAVANFSYNELGDSLINELMSA